MYQVTGDGFHTIWISLLQLYQHNCNIVTTIIYIFYLFSNYHNLELAKEVLTKVHFNYAFWLLFSIYDSLLIVFLDNC